MLEEFEKEFIEDIKNENLEDVILGDYIWDFCENISDCDEEEQGEIRSYIYSNFDYNRLFNINCNIIDFNITFEEINEIELITEENYIETLNLLEGK